jgi:16S rRNA (guanine966-N2)-methyltransferase
VRSRAANPQFTTAIHMRVIAGTFRSRKLRSLRGLDIRPTSDRLRETLFDVLTAGKAAALEGAVWIDLFAGTGAVGIEALSRGAAMVYFVESAKRAVELMNVNLESLGISDRFELLSSESRRALARLDARQIRPDFIFLDPPFRLHELYQETLSVLANSPMSERALVIAEHEKRFDPGEAFGKLRRARVLKQGDAGLSFYRVRAS